MSTYRYAVTVTPSPIKAWPHAYAATCPACPYASHKPDRRGAHAAAVDHAALCEALHRDNLAAACTCTQRTGRPHPACCACLGRGYERNPR